MIRCDKERVEAAVVNRLKAALNHAFATQEPTHRSLATADVNAQYRGRSRSATRIQGESPIGSQGLPMPPIAAPPGGGSEQPPVDRDQRRPAKSPAHLMRGDAQVVMVTRDVPNRFGPFADDLRAKQCGGRRPDSIVERI